MEEIRILVLFLMTLWGYFKMQQRRARSPIQLQQNYSVCNDVAADNRVQQHAVNNMVQPQEEHLSGQYQIPIEDIQSLIRDQALLFSSKTINKKQDPLHRQIIKSSNDFNDIFGGQYNKCISGKLCEIDEDIFSSKEIFSKNIFRKAEKHCNYYPLNQEHLYPLRHYIQSNQNFIEDRPSNMQMNPQLSNQSFMNTNNNYPFHFNFELKQYSQMDVQNNQRISSSEEQLRQKNIKKKKRIIKFNRPKLKKLNNKKVNENKSSENKPKIILRKPDNIVVSKLQKSKKFICIEDQIIKKQLQLEILRRIHRQQQK